MAYRNSSSGDFDFDKNDPGPGGFYAELFPSGNVMVGWGRPRRSKWAKLDQAEIVNFLTAAHKMVVTDDEVLKGMLSDLSRKLNPPQLTVAQIKDAADAGDDTLLRRFTELMLEGSNITEALRVMSLESPEPRALSAV